MTTQNRYYSSTAKAATVTDNPLLAGATQMNVSTKTGFPSSTPYTLILERDTNKEEVVTVTAESGLLLTITRAVGGTSAVQHSQGATVEHGVYSADYEEPQQHLNNGQIHNSRGPLWTGSVDALLCDSSYLMTNNEIHYYKYRAQESQVINFASFYVTVAGGASSDIDIGIYADSIGPTTLLGHGSTSDISSLVSPLGWWTVNMNTGVSLIQGHDYWIAVRCTAGSGAPTLLAKTVTAAVVATVDGASPRFKQGTGASLTSSPTTSTWTGTKAIAVNLTPSSRTVP